MAAASPISKARLEALSDGVYAVVLTLLVLELRLPPLPASSGSALDAALLALLPKALVWMLSFWVAALFWLAQGRVLRQSGEPDRIALLIELGHLALVTLLPFSSAVIGEHGDQVGAALLYSLHLALLAALSQLRVTRLLRHPELHAEAFDTPGIRVQARRGWIVLVCALAAVALAFVIPGWNMLAMLGALLHPPRPRGSSTASHRH
ncbi:MAG TPA: TMEM175 family protein [Ottowia sp.]|uniref:TMEM175 family protein n=1 Tax=Ottowia sp. TaxID=1898956 RepID=UPI002C442EC7|nr:TMEM175 family protein [Ottowia sp.]HMN20563.1 TMEM175 family protein [Ottowia sp.]